MLGNLKLQNFLQFWAGGPAFELLKSLLVWVPIPLTALKGSPSRTLRRTGHSQFGTRAVETPKAWPPALGVEGFDTMSTKRVYWKYLNLEDTSSEHFCAFAIERPGGASIASPILRVSLGGPHNFERFSRRR